MMFKLDILSDVVCFTCRFDTKSLCFGFKEIITNRCLRIRLLILNLNQRNSLIVAPNYVFCRETYLTQSYEK